MNTIKIEHNVPIPPNVARGRYPWAGLLEQMAVGDSFEVELSRSEIANIYVYGLRKNRKVAIRRSGENKYRVWVTKIITAEQHFDSRNQQQTGDQVAGKDQNEHRENRSTHNVQ